MQVRFEKNLDIDVTSNNVSINSNFLKRSEIGEKET